LNRQNNSVVSHADASQSDKTGLIIVIVIIIIIIITIMMDDGQYIPADEHARDALRAGLQTKKDDQPANTMRRYVAKQREWKK